MMRPLVYVSLVVCVLAAACAPRIVTTHKPLITEPTEEKEQEIMRTELSLSDAHVIGADAFISRVTDAGGSVTFVFEDDRPFAQCHASTITQAPDGTYVAAWFGGTAEKDPDVGIWMARFVDGDWTPVTQAAKIEESAHWNPVLFTDAEGEVHLFFKVGPEIPHWRTYWMSSSDNGESWSDPAELVPGDTGGRGPVRNKPIILSDGAWLAPASTEYQRWEAFADRSADRGQSWQRSDNFMFDRSTFPGRGVIQPTFWESVPGRVHALLRSGAGRVLRTDSVDYGITWTPVYDSGLPNNNSSADVLSLEDGRLMLVLNPVGMNWGPRTPLSLAMSRDNGKTWQLLAHFEDDPTVVRGQSTEYSYPAIIRTQDGIAVTYTWRRERVRAWFIPLEAIPDGV